MSHTTTRTAPRFSSAVPAVMLALAVALATAAGAAQRHLEIADFFALPELATPQVSPDGRSVAYEASHADLDEDEWTSSLHVVDVESGETRRLTAPDRSDSHPRWSPDGRTLAFLSSRPVKPGDDDDPEAQIWAYDLRGGDAQPLTAVEQGVSAFEWSPDSQRLVLVVRDLDPAEADSAKSAESDDEEERPRPIVTERRQFKRDYRGYLTARFTHLYVFSLADRKLVQLTTGDQDDSEPAWRPDGQAIAFTSNRSGDQDASQDTNVFVVDVHADGSPGVARQVTTNPGADGSPAWSPDGSTLVHVTQVEPQLMWYATQHLATVPAAGGEATVLTRALDRFVYAPRYSTDGSEILFLLEESGEQHVAAIPATGGGGARPSVRRLTSGERMVSSFHQGASGRIAALSSEPHLPAELFALDPAAKEPPRRLTRTHETLLAGLRLGEVLETTVRSADGTPVETFLTLPPDYEPKRRYPAILWIHGGPVGQYDWGFDFLAQLFAAHGYVVVRPNPRGSSGYGQDFCKAIFADWGNKDYDDVMAAVDHAVAEGLADPSRLGVGGWSYGGILTDNVIVKTGRFTAAISGAGEGLNISNYGHDHYQMEWELELGLPWENRELWERLSPFNQIEKVTTPTMFMGGALDWNVPILGSEQMYQALRRLGRTTQLVVYPGEHHGIQRPSFQRDRFERYLGWYARFLGGRAPTPPVAETTAEATVSAQP